MSGSPSLTCTQVCSFVAQTTYLFAFIDFCVVDAVNCPLYAIAQGNRARKRIHVHFSQAFSQNIRASVIIYKYIDVIPQFPRVRCCPHQLDADMFSQHQQRKGSEPGPLDSLLSKHSGSPAKG